MTDDTLPFAHLADGIGVGEPPPTAWLPLTRQRLLIIVGVTGVGKSTLLAEFARAAPGHRLLPDRRDVTDRLIIAAMQQADGQLISPVRDRKLRFEYSRRYRKHHPGGMAHALTQLWVAPALSSSLLIFDGLRGENEVVHAASLLPQAAFVLLDAPDYVRVQRLLGRNDAFDLFAVTDDRVTAPQAVATFAALGVPDAARLFSSQEENALLTLAQTGAVNYEDLCAKLQIVVEERLSYDPATTRDALLAAAPQRTLVIDTVAYPPAKAAELLLKWLPAVLPQPGSV
jgi:hypothetical protein